MESERQQNSTSMRAWASAVSMAVAAGTAQVCFDQAQWFAGYIALGVSAAAAVVVVRCATRMASDGAAARR